MPNKPVPTIPPAVKLSEIIDRLRAKSTTMQREAEALGFTSTTPLSKAIRALIGDDAYFAILRAKSKIGNGIRPESGQSKPAPDDSGLPIVEAMTAQAGWTWRRVNEHEPIPRAVPIKDRGTLRVMDTGAQILVVRSPEGIEYTQAADDEPADLLRVNVLYGPSGPPTRFVQWEKSRRRKQVMRGERGAAKLEAHVAAQKAKRSTKGGAE